MQGGLCSGFSGMLKTLSLPLKIFEFLFISFVITIILGGEHLAKQINEGS